MSTMTAAYLAAMAKSYANQEGGVTIPADQLDRIVEVQLGFQPLGISRRHAESDDDILVAAYFEPAVLSAKVARDEKGLHFAVNWIRGCNHGIQSVRLFPDVSQPGGANRAQCVFYGPDGQNVWVNRNGERDFFVLHPPNQQGGRWTLVGKVILPLPKPNEHQMVHSATLTEKGQIITTESVGDLSAWTMERYSFKQDGEIKWEGSSDIAPWCYGIAVRDGKVWTVTDYRAEQTSHGIYRNNEQVVHGVCGNGIAFLSDGSALVTRYGQSYPGCFNGIPGALIYVPTAMLEV